MTMTTCERARRDDIVKYGLHHQVCIVMTNGESDIWNRTLRGKASGNEGLSKRIAAAGKTALVMICSTAWDCSPRSDVNYE